MVDRSVRFVDYLRIVEVIARRVAKALPSSVLLNVAGPIGSHKVSVLDQIDSLVNIPRPASQILLAEGSHNVGVKQHFEHDMRDVMRVDISSVGSAVTDWVIRGTEISVLGVISAALLINRRRYQHEETHFSP